MKQNKTLRDIRNMLGLSRRIIQGYEENKLVSPSDKNKYGHNLYDEDAIKRIAYIRFYQELGFELREISEFIDSPIDELIEILKERSLTIQKQIGRLIEEYDIIQSFIENSDDKRFEREIMKIIQKES